jgi:methyl-accepting chemotaxis protein
VINRRRWRNFLIFPKIQGELIFWGVWTGSFFILFYAAFVYSNVHAIYGIVRDQTEANLATLQLLHREFIHSLLSFSMGAFVSLLIGSLALLVVSHRVLGPFVQFMHVFKRIKDGDLSARIRLRPNDRVHFIANEFNDMMDSLEKKFASPSKSD